MSEPETYRGRSLTIHFDGQRCVHARNCVVGAPRVFKANVEGPWIDPDAIAAEELAAIARSCPSGAITYERHDGGPAERPPEVNTAKIRENGPIALAGDITIDGHGTCLRATLCRCGASQRKPFCDGSHAAAGFAATGEPTAGDTAALAARDGALAVKPAPNGPLLVTGNLEVLGGTGRLVARTVKCALCRCGGSQNKPYCDGSHRTNGFSAP
jgi:CDGSH-type Zn-finger protein/uncharacterized Fe-S cluster protein YjdI